MCLLYPYASILFSSCGWLAVVRLSPVSCLVLLFPSFVCSSNVEMSMEYVRRSSVRFWYERQENAVDSIQS